MVWIGDEDDDSACFYSSFFLKKLTLGCIVDTLGSDLTQDENSKRAAFISP